MELTTHFQPALKLERVDMNIDFSICLQSV